MDEQGSHDRARLAAHFFCITMNKDNGTEVIPMAAMTVTTKGQVTIPKEIRELLGPLRT